MRDTDIAYLAGIIDGEGYIGIKKTRRKECVSPTYQARIQVRMVDEPAIAFLAQTLGGSYYEEQPRVPKGRPLYCFQASDARAEAILRAVLPFLRVKRKSAEAVLAYRDMQARSHEFKTKLVGEKNFPNMHGTARMVPVFAFSDEYIARCEAVYARCKDLNRVGV